MQRVNLEFHGALPVTGQNFATKVILNKSFLLSANQNLPGYILLKISMRAHEPENCTGKEAGRLFKTKAFVSCTRRALHERAVHTPTVFKEEVP